MATALSLPVVVSGDGALAAFRQGLTGAYALSLLRQGPGQMLILLPVGVGKTGWLVATIIHALTIDRQHDLVVVLVPRWDILRELLSRLPANLHRVVLSPRPRSRCGDLDGEWLVYEQNGCGSLGRERLCGACPSRRHCSWPGQYGSHLRGTRLILATQQHLTLNPQFIAQLCQQTRAENPLVLIDESGLLIRRAERFIRQQELDNFIIAQEMMLAAAAKRTSRMREWLNLSRLVAQAPTPDLRGGHWQFPWVDGHWATEVQRAGVESFGLAFRFLGHELHHFARSDPAGRERLTSGDLRYATIPYLGKKFVICSGSMARDLARYRLDPNHARPALVSPFEHYRFEHPGTRWYNLCIADGAARFFPGNASRILDFFAALVARNIREGKRSLLVSRKRFLRMCQTGLRKRLNGLGVGPVKVVSGNWDRHNLDDPRVVALINYGVAGINRFEHVEAAYCLNSYYVSAWAVSQAVQDIEASSERYPLAVRSVGNPPRRQVHITLPDAREPILPRIAQGTLDQLEADVVIQAVGRVRPFTRPREVITFHTGDLPGVRYTFQFRSLAKARDFFNVQTPTQATHSNRVEHVRRMRALGRTLKDTAQELNVSVATIKRDLRA